MLNDREDYWVLAGIVGVIALFLLWAAYSISQEKSEPPQATCNGEEMRPGDVCTTFRGRHGVTSRTYEESMPDEWEWNTNDTIVLATGIGMAALSLGLALKPVIRPPAKVPRRAGTFQGRPYYSRSPSDLYGSVSLHTPVISLQDRILALYAELSDRGVEELKAMYRNLYEGTAADRSMRMGTVRHILLDRGIDVNWLEAGLRGTWHGAKKTLVGTPPLCFHCGRQHWTAQRCSDPRVKPGL